MRVISACRFQDAAPHVIAGDHRCNHLSAAHRTSRLVQRREKGRQDNGAGVIAAAGIVQLESMRCHTVHQCSVSDGACEAGSPDPNLAGRANGSDGKIEFLRPRARKCRAERVGNVDLCLGDNGCRQGIVVEGGGESSQPIDRRVGKRTAHGNARMRGDGDLQKRRC